MTQGQAALLLEKAATRRGQELTELATVVRIAVNADGKNFKKAIDSLSGRKPPEFDPAKIREFMKDAKS